MSTSFDINLIFDKKRLKELPEMLRWISDRCFPEWKCKINFPNGEKEFNFGDWKEHLPEDGYSSDFSKGIPEMNGYMMSIMFKLTDELRKDLLETLYWKEDEIKELEKKTKPGHITLGFDTSIWGHADSTMGKDKFTIQLGANLQCYSYIFNNQRNEEAMRFLLEFCRKFKPYAGVFTYDFKIYKIKGEPNPFFWESEEKKKYDKKNSPVYVTSPFE